MKKTTKAFPFILVFGFILYLSITEFDKLNRLKIFGFSLGLLISLYFIFIVTTDRYIDFRDGLKIKKIKKD